MRFKNKKVAILGWGINGLDAAKYLLKDGAEITIFDQKEKKELDFSGFDLAKVKLVLGKSYLDKGFKNFDYVFRAPAVYRFIPQIVEAEENGVVITSVTKLFFDLSPAKIIGVTGTKGKGTTSTLIYEILKFCGKDVYLAGNIGSPMLELLPKLTKKSWVVLELSSFQLIDLDKSPHIAVVLNITEDHLDWHRDRREYVEAKTRIVRNQKPSDYSVIAYDYSTSKNFSKITKSRVFYFSNSQKVKGSYVEDGRIFLEIEKDRSEVCNTKNLLLRGRHNWENVCAATCASYLAGADVNSIRQKVLEFKGLEHRLELVGKFGGVTFYDDSFSTNPQTTIAAIESFEEPLTIILGGSSKGLNYDEMAKRLARKKNVRSIILIGEISDLIRKSIRKAKFRGVVVKLGMSDMTKIVEKSFEVTPSGGVVLLSPATASFDMFKDYKDRGNQFKKAVMNLNSKKLTNKYAA